MNVVHPKVAVVKCPDYGRATVERAVDRLLDLLGGIGPLIPSGAGVLIKPNMLAAHSPEAAVTTHPEVLRAVTRRIIEAGGRVTLGDSPGIGSFASVAAKTGLAQVAEELGVRAEPLDDPVEVPRPAGARFRRLRLARRAVEAEVIVNLPKVKTHQQMFLTLAVKNLFGCVAGREKIAWHLSAGRDAALFARVLVEIGAALRPGLNLADGVVGMEGTGPSHGEVRPFGFLAASTDAFALDAALTRLLGFRTEDVPLFAAAEAARADGMDLGAGDWDAVDWLGDPPEAVAPGRVKPPIMGRLMFVPPFFARRLRRFLTVRPRIQAEVCRACGVCVASCPAQAMKIIDRKVQIDDTLCIRCFCCQELCPHDAVRVRRGLWARLFSR
jgi:uncharacterized protein (DUF362 family)/Pyruvate/2-oxoacid:ferredoxin oxidoreductase delta subunit